MKNESMESEQLLVFLYSVIEKGLEITNKVKINDFASHRDYGLKIEH
jgi:hypothetical protein